MLFRHFCMFSYFCHCIYSAIQLSSCKCVLNKLSCQLSWHAKQCHFMVDYNFHFSWWILTLLVPVETGMDALQFTYYVVLSLLTTSLPHHIERCESSLSQTEIRRVVKMKIPSKTRAKCKRFFAGRLLKEFPNKAGILNTSYNKTGRCPNSHTDSFFCWAMKYSDDWLRNVSFLSF